MSIKLDAVIDRIREVVRREPGIQQSKMRVLVRERMEVTQGLFAWALADMRATGELLKLQRRGFNRNVYYCLAEDYSQLNGKQFFIDGVEITKRGSIAQIKRVFRDAATAGASTHQRYATSIAQCVGWLLEYQGRAAK